MYMLDRHLRWGRGFGESGGSMWEHQALVNELIRIRRKIRLKAIQM
jgi:hypothetical protein